MSSRWAPDSRHRTPPSRSVGSSPSPNRSDEDRLTLESWTRSSMKSAGYVGRARIELAVAGDVGRTAAAQQMGVPLALQ